MNIHTIKTILLSEKTRAFVLSFLFILAAFICFYKLGYAKFDDWDEAWYAEMTKEMLNTKQFIVMQWNHAFLFDKPPLYIWSSAIFVSLFGLSEFSIRFTSAITGFLTIILAVWYSYKKWGIIPSLLTFSTLALNNIYIWRVRSGNLDALVTFLIFLVFLVATSKRSFRYPLLGLLFALIFLAKASLVGFPLVIFGLYELIYNYKTIIKNLPEYIKLIVIFIIVSGSWLQLGERIAGQEFVNYYLYKSDQGVSNTSLDLFKTDYIWHTYYSLQRRFFFVFVFGLLALLASIRKGSHFMIFCFSLFLLTLLSFTERNNNWYLTPSIPFWALTIGFGGYSFINLVKKQIFQIPAIIIVLLLTVYVSQKTFRENIIPLINTSSSMKQTETALLANKLTKEGDIIARLDHLYPTAIYYSDRKVFSSPSGNSGNSDLFIGRDTLAERIRKNEIRIIMGKKNEVADFVTLYSLEGTLHDVNDEETVFEAIIPSTQ